MMCRASIGVLVFALGGCSALLDFKAFHAAADAPALDGPADAASPDADVSRSDVALEDALSPTDLSDDNAADAPSDSASDAPDAPPMPLVPPSPIVQVAAGYFHTCARLADGSVWCWGDNEWGQLGDNGASHHRARPERVALPGGMAADDLVTGGFHTCARLTPSRSVVCWGRNDYGQLGDGTTTSRASPVRVLDLDASPWRLAAGQVHTCAARPGGPVRCWGYNGNGQCGSASPASVTTPNTVAGVTATGDVVAGQLFTCARTPTGLFCWGANDYGQLGDPAVAAPMRSAPGPVVFSPPLTEPVASIFAGGYHACARTLSGRTLCWGRNDQGQIPGVTVNPPSTAVEVPEFASVGLVLGALHQCTIGPAGALRCSGDNALGEVGDGTRIDRARASDTPVLTGVSMAAAGELHTCAVTADGALRCWGALGYGQLGNGVEALSTTPEQVQGLPRASDLAAGRYHTCAVAGDPGRRHVYCWGYNAVGQLGTNALPVEPAPQAVRDLTPTTGAPLTDVRAVTTGFGHGCALMESGAVRCWGQNQVGQLGVGSRVATPFLAAQVPVDLSAMPASALASGDSHSCARRADGQVLCWGSDAFGQCGAGMALDARLSPSRAVLPVGTTVTGVAAGALYSCALTASNAVLCWGRNDLGQCGQAPSAMTSPGAAVARLTGVLDDLALGGSHGCAYQHGGSLWCWGSNARGQLALPPASTPSSLAVTVTGVPAVQHVGAGRDHTCAAGAAGLFCWGAGNRGQTGVATFDDRSSPSAVTVPGTVDKVAAGVEHTCALTSDGRVFCWGSNHVGQLGRVDLLSVTTAALGGVRWW